MRSLRGRLILSTTLGAAVVLAAATVLLYVLIRDSLTAQFDRALLDKARMLAAVVEWEHGRIDLEFDDLEMHEFVTPSQPAYLQVWRDGDAVIFRSSSLGTIDLERTVGQKDSPLFRPVRLPDGRAGRAVSLTFTPRVDEDDDGGGDDEDSHPARPMPALTLVLARGTAPIDATLARFEVLTVSVGLSAIAVLAIVLWLVVRRSLKPVDHLAAQIDQLDERALAETINLPDVPAELQPVVERLNGLLGRLEAAFQRERSFSADVAHELRTPLAGLRSTMDVTLTKPRPAQEYQEVIGRCRGMTVQVQKMVEHLLSLARLDAGQVEITSEPIHLSELIEEAWHAFSTAAEARGLSVEWSLEAKALINSDRALLGLVIRNILENAVVHTDEGGAVKIQTVAREHEVEMCVVNTGSQLTQDKATEVFDRFWRGDAARTAAGVHCGLGLSLAKKAVEVLGGTLLVQTELGGEFQLTARVPHLFPILHQ